MRERRHIFLNIEIGFWKMGLPFETDICRSQPRKIDDRRRRVVVFCAFLYYRDQWLIVTCRLAFNASPYIVGLCVSVGLFDGTPLDIDREKHVSNIRNSAASMYFLKQKACMSFP